MDSQCLVADELARKIVQDALERLAIADDADSVALMTFHDDAASANSENNTIDALMAPDTEQPKLSSAHYQNDAADILTAPVSKNDNHVIAVSGAIVDDSPSDHVDSSTGSANVAFLSISDSDDFDAPQCLSSKNDTGGESAASPKTKATSDIHASPEIRQETEPDADGKNAGIIDNHDKNLLTWEEEATRFLESVRPLFTASNNAAEASVGLLKEQFLSVHCKCPLPPHLFTSAWRFMTDEWTHDARTGKDRFQRLKRLSFDRFAAKWKALATISRGDPCRIAFEVMKGSHPCMRHLSGDSIEPVIEGTASTLVLSYMKDVVVMHTELQFLQGNLVFQHRYIETVITRIFYTVARTLPPLDDDVINGRVKGISWNQFRTLYPVLSDLHECEINEEHLFFSYKHFFVIYCKYYDLSLEGSVTISTEQVECYDHCGLSHIVCQRIASGACYPPAWRAKVDGKYLLNVYTHGLTATARSVHAESGVDLTDDRDTDETIDSRSTRRVGILTYPEFIWLLLSEEDRSTETALEYWYRVIDLDDDHVVSLYELEQLWEHQEERLLQDSNAMFDFRDILCVALDLLNKPHQAGLFDSVRTFPHDSEILPPIVIRLQDLKRNREAASRFLDYFVNRHKLIDRENSNGNRLPREVDELKQAYFQQLQFLPTPLDDGNAAPRSSLFDPARIPVDSRTSWSRWADHEYEMYIMQDEQDRERDEHRRRGQVDESVLTDQTMDDDDEEDEDVDAFVSSCAKRRPKRRWSRKESTARQPEYNVDDEWDDSTSDDGLDVDSFPELDHEPDQVEANDDDDSSSAIWYTHGGSSPMGTASCEHPAFKGNASPPRASGFVTIALKSSVISDGGTLNSLLEEID